tara:strand:+ start:121 stop:651 length:531 start_codon:yes stop_codon:yes gene_type:complete
MAGKGEHVMDANHPSIGCENMPKKNTNAIRKDMKTTYDAMSQMLSDNVNKVDKVLDGVYIDTKAKYHNGKQKTVVAVGITNAQMNALKDMMNAVIDFQKSMKQTASVVNRIARAKVRIGRIDDFINGVITDADGENRIMTKPMIAKAKADAKALADKKADALKVLADMGIDPKDLV